MGGLQISYADIATDCGMFNGSPWEKPQMSSSLIDRTEHRNA